MKFHERIWDHTWLLHSVVSIVFMTKDFASILQYEGSNSDDTVSTTLPHCEIGVLAATLGWNQNMIHSSSKIQGSGRYFSMDTERLFAFKSGAVGCLENVGDMRDCIIKLSRNDDHH